MRKNTMFVSIVSEHNSKLVDPADSGGQSPGVGMIVGQPIDVVIQGVERGGGQHADLPHSPAQNLAMAERLGNQIAWTGQGRTDRRPEPLAETNADGVEVLGPPRGGDAGGNHRVPEACAVKMRSQTVLAGPAADGLDRFIGLNSPSAAVVRVFDGQQASAGEMRIVGPDQAGQLVEPHDAEVAGHRLERPRG